MASVRCKVSQVQVENLCHNSRQSSKVVINLWASSPTAPENLGGESLRNTLSFPIISEFTHSSITKTEGQLQVPSYWWNMDLQPTKFTFFFPLLLSSLSCHEIQGENSQLLNWRQDPSLQYNKLKLKCARIAPKIEHTHEEDDHVKLKRPRQLQLQF